MHILLTGASGRVGSYVLTYLLSQGHTVLATDLFPLPPRIPSSPSLQFITCDLTDYDAVDRLFSTANPPIEGVLHLGAIPDPENDDPRKVHNNNVAGSYNVLRTAVMYGVKRIVQASSVNATGLSYTPEGHQRFDELPITEEHEMRPEEPYGLSKQICELQALSITRAFPSVRIASLRFHHVVPSYTEGVAWCMPRELFAWVSEPATARACLLGLTSEGWSGAEAFNIVSPEISWEGTVDEKSKVVVEGEKVGTVQLLERYWAGRFESLREGYYGVEPGGAGWRRGVWDVSKAEKLLGWRHDEGV